MAQTCGAWMPQAKELCARRPGHGTEHRTRYALDNNYRMNTGREPRRRIVDARLPGRCRGCGAPVRYGPSKAGWRVTWRDADGRRHRCAIAA